MKIEEQVLTIEQMQSLKELGLEVKDTALVLDAWEDPCLNDIHFKSGIAEGTPTFTLQETLDLLPEEIRFEGKRAFLIIDKSDKQISYTAEDYDGNLNIDCMFFENESLLQAAYNMLCWCARNGYLKK